MINNNTILTDIKGSTATIWLNRPAKHNALDLDMISGFLIAMQYLNNATDVRVIVIRGKGKSFCAGADLNWMQRSSILTPAENYNECEVLAKCFYELYSSSKITVCLVHGSCIGGANGFVGASDFAFADPNTVFGFSEVRIGIVPAIIAPYVTRKAGKSKTLELMLTGRKFSAGEAYDRGLISKSVPYELMDASLDGLLEELILGAPRVQQMIKKYLNGNDFVNINQPVIEQSAALLAETRIMAEAKEGIISFFEKRKPEWKH